MVAKCRYQAVEASGNIINYERCPEWFRLKGLTCYNATKLLCKLANKVSCSVIDRSKKSDRSHLCLIVDLSKLGTVSDAEVERRRIYEQYEIVSIKHKELKYKIKT